MNRHAQPETRKPNRWLVLLRWAVIGYAIFSLAAAAAGTALFPGFAARHLSDFTLNDFWTFEQTQAGLVQLGWPPTTVVWVELARALLFGAVAGAVGLLILWRKSEDWFGLYLTFVLVSIVSGDSITQPLVELIPGLGILYNLMSAVGWQLLFIIFYFFPDGRPVPDWTRWLALAWVGYNVLYRIFPGLDATWVSVGFVLSALGSQIFRYFRKADPIQRQQTKWVLYVVGIMIAVLALVAPRAFVPPTGPDFGAAMLVSLVNYFIFNAMFLLFPIALLISILRYRLWDIDILVRRTLVYSLLSVLLGLVYYGGVVVLQSVLTADRGRLTAVGGQPSAVVIVITTLAIAALFNPLRKRIQDFIDRRFYRRKYDAEKALAEFAAAARSETELDLLSGKMMQVANESLQPEFSQLWLVQKKGESPHAEL